jgi:hypothetical protein
MMADRPRRENQPFGNLDVAQAIGKQLQNLEFTRRERRRIGRGTRSWTPRDVTDPELPKAACDDPGSRQRAEPLQRSERGAEIVLVGGSGASERCVVRTAEIVPQGGSCAVLAF